MRPHVTSTSGKRLEYVEAVSFNVDDSSILQLLSEVGIVPQRLHQPHCTDKQEELDVGLNTSEGQARKATQSDVESLFSILSIEAFQALRRSAEGQGLSPKSGTFYKPKELACAYSDPRDEPYYRAGKQSILDHLGMPYLWTLPGGQGQGVQVADLQMGWYSHRDLLGLATIVADRTVPIEYTEKHIPVANHGTQTLTVLGARTNEFGMAGTAPQLERVILASVYCQFEDGKVLRHTPWAIIAATQLMGAGDVLLIEVSLASGHPLELESVYVQEALLKAIEKGIVVVAAAGNKSIRLNRNLIAITVGSGLKLSSSVGRDPTSNYGPAVDCFSWGQGILSGISTSSGGDGYGSFLQTSAAAASIAGLVACVQGARKAGGQRPLKHSEVRALLRLPGTGSTQVEGIGTMPHASTMFQRSLEID